MSETKKDCRQQLKYMLDNQVLYLKKISINEFMDRVNKLKKQIKTGIEQ